MPHTPKVGSGTEIDAAGVSIAPNRQSRPSPQGTAPPSGCRRPGIHAVPIAEHTTV